GHVAGRAVTVQELVVFHHAETVDQPALDVRPEFRCVPKGLLGDRNPVGDGLDRAGLLVERQGRFGLDTARAVRRRRFTHDRRVVGKRGFLEEDQGVGVGLANRQHVAKAAERIARALEARNALRLQIVGRKAARGDKGTLFKQRLEFQRGDAAALPLLKAPEVVGLDHALADALARPSVLLLLRGSLVRHDAGDGSAAFLRHELGRGVLHVLAKLDLRTEVVDLVDEGLGACLVVGAHLVFRAKFLQAGDSLIELVPHLCECHALAPVSSAKRAMAMSMSKAIFRRRAFSSGSGVVSAGSGSVRCSNAATRSATSAAWSSVRVPARMCSMREVIASASAMERTSLMVACSLAGKVTAEISQSRTSSITRTSALPCLPLKKSGAPE